MKHYHLLSFILISILLILFTACSEKTVTKTVTLPETTKTVIITPPAKTETTTVTFWVEPTIPSHFVTYTEENLFSISYPPHWVSLVSTIDETSDIAMDLLESIDRGASAMQYLFIGGNPVEGGWYYPFVNVANGYAGTEEFTLKEIVNSRTRWYDEYLQEYQIYSRMETIVDGREAIIIDASMKDTLIGEFRLLMLYTIRDEFLWLVTCTSYPDEFPQNEYDFYNVVSSIRIF